MGKSTRRSFGFSNNDEIEYLKLTPELTEEAVDVLNRSFLINESVCKASEINIPNNPDSIQARKDLSELCRIVARDGVSLVAKHVPSNKIVSVAFNKVQFIDPAINQSFFEEFRDVSCLSPNSKCLMNYMINMDQRINVFDQFSIDCVIEIMFLATLPEFERKGIGRNLTKYSVNLAEELGRGVGTEHIDESLVQRVPKGVAALWTSSYSAIIGKN
ncbi:hypothetical protein ACFFRR_000730 [Megaselia abdita]